MKIEKFISGKGIEKLINNKLTAKQIFKNTKKIKIRKINFRFSNKIS